jgi:serine/threonine protein kinase HipA of HipAB toxin-antitoxin module
MGYPELAQLLRRSGVAPEGQNREQMGDLFQRMVFNLLIDNTDDHEKNHVSLITESGALQFPPAFDVLPSGTRSRGCHSRQRWVPEAPLVAARHGKQGGARVI